jgi:transcriptional regulator of acetoin/glycerol metabolism
MDLPRETGAGVRAADEARDRHAAPSLSAGREQGPGAAGSREPRRARLRSTGPTRNEITAALEAQRWRIAETSRALGISRTTLWRLMRELDLRR